eukprot:TRINITY_DN21423_c0_g1_i2.p1 TRINITY_DN21423_c0_g1~~TRINITY_DN21423_c0_g1_i2.p1  ORF type:complete len:639 (+),score=234.60 TRINITY_DN21423_c0_g1_i2:1485-3401(+)
MLWDQETKKLYVVTHDRVLEIQPLADSKGMWRSFFQRAADTAERDREEYYKTSLRLCPDPVWRERVRVAAGDFYFERGDYIQAARVHSQTNKSFEETTLRLSQCGNPRALLTFLICRLDFMSRREEVSSSFNQERSQRHLICTWVITLYLDLMNSQTSDAEQEALRAEYHGFLRKQLGTRSAYPALDHRVVRELIKAHGRPEEVLHFATLTKDFATVVEHYVQHERYDLALATLGDHCMGKEYEKLWYQFSPQLMRHDPVQLVNMWQRSELKAARLIPAILSYSPEMNPPCEKQHQDVRYLRWLMDKGGGVEGEKDTFLYSLLLTCYAKQSSEEPLLAFIKEMFWSPQRESFDLNYALRLCRAHGHQRACVLVLSAMDMYEDAVEAALEIPDVELAKEQVGFHAEAQPKESEGRKKLWSLIFKKVVQTRDGVSEAIAMVKELRRGDRSDDLSIEDVLSQFPETVPIQDLKEELAAALDKYDEDIAELQRNMQEKTEEAAALSDYIKQARQESVVLVAGQQCDACGERGLTTEGFYAFHCGHAFHQECLVRPPDRFAPLPAGQRKEARALWERIKVGKDRLRENDDDDAHGAEQQRALLRDMQQRVDELVGGQCPLCGDAMIREAQRPLFDPGDDLHGL